MREVALGGQRGQKVGGLRVSLSNSQDAGFLTSGHNLVSTRPAFFKKLNKIKILEFKVYSKD